MRRLFWKLFLSYWLALIVFSTLTLYSINHYLEQVRARYEAVTSLDDVRAHMQSATLSAAGGLKELQAWAHRVDEQELVPWFVLDAAGRDILQRETSLRLLDRLRRYQRTSARDESQRSGATEPGAQRGPLAPVDRELTLADGSRYWLIPDYQNASLSRLLSRPRVLAMPIALAVIVGGIVSILLARYLASPIERLRRATRGYAAGDFSQRVGPTLGRRRDEIVDLAHALDEMAERLDALLSAQRNLLRDVSHELRSPLARAQAALGLARQRGHGAEEEITRIEQEMERLSDLVGTILAFSRLESGAQPLAREAMDLRELLATAIEDARLEGIARKVTLHVEGDDAAAPFQGDPSLIHSAFENILRNAVRHSPDGGVIAVSLERPARSAARPEYVIQFRDSGPGVPEAMLDKIFGPFVRVDGTHSGGVGLGLAITRRAILAHGGGVRAENASGDGLRVIVRLPAEQ